MLLASVCQAGISSKLQTVTRCVPTIGDIVCVRTLFLTSSSQLQYGLWTQMTSRPHLWAQRIIKELKKHGWQGDAVVSDGVNHHICYKQPRGKASEFMQPACIRTMCGQTHNACMHICTCTYGNSSQVLLIGHQHDHRG